MKPLRLRMYGVGPYAESVDIDFEKLNEEGLFLITGATGAGKTSIFDGITYALYGETNYGDADKKNGIICDFLGEEEHGNAYVEFSFEVDGTEYTVRRGPAYYKVKNGRRNKTKTGESVEIEANPVRSIPGKKEDRDRFIREEILKVDAAQFKKLIMLPQGAFSEFIRSNSKAKKETLEKIFDTGIYEEISLHLRNKVKELGTGIARERERIFAKLETLDLEDDRWTSLIGERLLSFDELQGILEAGKNNILRMNEQLNKDIEGIDIKAVTEEIARGEALNKGIADLRTAKTALEEHRKRAGEMESMEQDLERYRKAQKIRVEYAAKERALKDYLRKEEEYSRDRRSLEEYRELNDRRIEELDDVKRALKEAGDRVNTLEVLKKDVERYLELVKGTGSDKIRLKDLKGDKLSGLRDREEKAAAEGEGIAAGIRIISAQLERAGELRVKVERLEGRKNLLDGLALEHERNLRDGKRLAQMEDELEELKRGELEALKEYSRANSLLLQAEAYKLSGELREGESCPVCGSKEHPGPAEKPAGVPERGEVEGYKAAYDSAGRRKNIQKGEVEGFRGGLEERRETLAEKLAREGIEGGDELRRFAERAGEELKKLVEELSGLPGRDNLTKAEDDSERNRRSLEEIGREIQEAEREIEALKTKIHMEEEECSNLGTVLEKRKIDADTFESTFKSLVDERARLEKEAGEGERLREERGRMESHLLRDERNLAELKESMGAAVRAFEEKLSQEGFQNEGEYLEGEALDGEVLGREITSYKDEGIRLRTIIEEKREYEDREEISLAELLKRRDELTDKIEGLRGEAAKNTSKIAALEERAGDLKATESRIGKEEKVLSVYKKLSDISEGRYGDKKNNITFQNYVLGVYFEEVLDRANERFAVMTSNQYEMVLHRKERSGKGEAGLDINVFDSHTGRERSIKTLSGGETFKASMALALGLSDVVQGQNGGIQLDSVFIDEGFGTLDDESLSAAMDILMELKSSGRTVGIISHVNELKQTINCQIRVEKSTRGSSVEVVY